MKKLLFLSFLSIAFLSCSSSDDGTPVDNGPEKNTLYPVHLTLDTKVGGVDTALGNKDRQKAITEPRTETDKLGYKGIILYSDNDHMVHAYDLACPNCWNGNVLAKVNNPTTDYYCKACGLRTALKYGFGSFANDKDKVIYLVKYKVTKTDIYSFEVANPSK